MEELSARLGRTTIFFRLEWNRLQEEQANALLTDPVLAKYRHSLAAMRRFASHQLGQEEEELLQELGPVGRSAWNVLFEKLMGRMKFAHSGRSEEEVLADLYSGKRAVRAQAAAELTSGLRQHLHILTISSIPWRRKR